MTIAESPVNLRKPSLEFTDAHLAELNDEFERLPATKIIQWAVEQFSPHLAMSASMTDAVLIDLAVKVAPAIEVVFIDTGYHFPETLATVEERLAYLEKQSRAQAKDGQDHPTSNVVRLPPLAAE